MPLTHTVTILPIIVTSVLVRAKLIPKPVANVFPIEGFTPIMGDKDQCQHSKHNGNNAKYYCNNIKH